MTTKTAANLLGLNYNTVNKWCRANLELRQIGRRLEYDILPEHIEVMKNTITPGRGMHGKGGRKITC